MIRRDTLTLDADGFTIATLGRSRTIPWTDVELFREGTLGGPGIANRAVVWDYRPGAEPRGAGFGRLITGAQAALPHTFGMEPAELVDLLEDWRRKSALMKGRGCAQNLTQPLESRLLCTQRQNR